MQVEKIEVHNKKEDKFTVVEKFEFGRWYKATNTDVAGKFYVMCLERSGDKNSYIEANCFDMALAVYHNVSSYIDLGFSERVRFEKMPRTFKITITL